MTGQGMPHSRAASRSGSDVGIRASVEDVVALQRSQAELVRLRTGKRERRNFFSGQHGLPDGYELR
jgi:hypothetical protein